MSETFHFGLSTCEVKRLFSDLVKTEGSIALALTNLLNRDKNLHVKYRFRSLAQCEVWDVNLQPGRDTIADLSPVLYMLDTYVRFNRLDSRSAALEELLLANKNTPIGCSESADESCQTEYRCSLLQKMPICNKETQTDSFPTIDHFVQAGIDVEDTGMQTDPIQLMPRNEFVQIGAPVPMPTQANAVGSSNVTINARRGEIKAGKRRRTPGHSKQTNQNPNLETTAQVFAPTGNMIFYRPPFPRGHYASFPFTHPPVPTSAYAVANIRGSAFSGPQSIRSPLIPSLNSSFKATCGHASAAANDVIKIVKMNDSLNYLNDRGMEYSPNTIGLDQHKCVSSASLSDCNEKKLIQEKKMMLDSLLYPNRSPIKDTSKSTATDTASREPGSTTLGIFSPLTGLPNHVNCKVPENSTHENAFVDVQASSRSVLDVPPRCKRARKQTEFYRAPKPSTAFEFAAF